MGTQLPVEDRQAQLRGERRSSSSDRNGHSSSTGRDGEVILPRWDELQSFVGHSYKGLAEATGSLLCGVTSAFGMKARASDVCVGSYRQDEIPLRKIDYNIPHRHRLSWLSISDLLAEPQQAPWLIDEEDNDLLILSDSTLRITIPGFGQAWPPDWDNFALSHVAHQVSEILGRDQPLCYTLPEHGTDSLSLRPEEDVSFSLCQKATAPRRRRALTDRVFWQSRILRRLSCLTVCFSRALSALVATLNLLGTALSTAAQSLNPLWRRRRRVNGQPNPDMLQRLVTSFIRFIHYRQPQLLAHPLLYGHAYPWLWLRWRSWRRRWRAEENPAFEPLAVIRTIGVPKLPPLGRLMQGLSKQLDNTEVENRYTSVAAEPRADELTDWTMRVQDVATEQASASTLLSLRRESRAHMQDNSKHQTANVTTGHLSDPGPPIPRHSYSITTGGGTAAIHNPYGQPEDETGKDATSQPPTYDKGPDLFTSYFPQEMPPEHGPPAQSEDLAKPHSSKSINEAAVKGQNGQMSSVNEDPAASGQGTSAVPSKGIGLIESLLSLSKTKSGTVAADKGSAGGQGKSDSDEVQEEADHHQQSHLSDIPRKQDTAVEESAAKTAYGRLVADMSEQSTADIGVAPDPVGLSFAIPWAATAESLGQIDHQISISAIKTAQLVQSKGQLWRYIQEIGTAPLLTALSKHKKLEEHVDVIARAQLRTEAVESILNLIKVALDPRVIRLAVEGPNAVPVIGQNVFSDLIDLIEEPLLLIVPRLIKPRPANEMLYRGQRAAVEVLYRLVLASDRAIKLIQEDGRLWNALQQLTAQSMYAPGSSTYVGANKLLAAIGYNVWRPKNAGQRGLRILSFDGGGTKGVMSIALLRQIMDRVGKKVSDTFDIICGTSTGGILAVLMGIEKRPLPECELLYDQLVKRIFTAGPLQSAKLLLRQAYYDESVWELVLSELLGDQLMIDSMGEGPNAPKVFVASLSLKTNPSSLFLWRNYAFAPDQRPKYGGTFRVMVRDALRATTAAPTYFSPFEKEEGKYCDGAFLANNPTAVALSEVRTLYPGVPIELVLSIGTGEHSDERKEGSAYGWDGIIGDLVACATQTEITHEALSIFLPKSKYFRFNPRTEVFPLDEVKPERLQRMKHIAREFFAIPENMARRDQLIDLLLRGAGPLPPFRPT